MERKEKLLELARAIALVAHDGQVDEQGVDYFKHPEAVSSACNTLDAKIVGFLHNVVEDTPITIDNLKAIGFDEDILEALRCVTKEPGYHIDEYLLRIKANPIAKEVKLADLKHNSNIDRIMNGPENCREKLLKKRKKYLAEIAFLEGTPRFFVVTNGKEKGLVFKVVDYIDYCFENGSWVTRNMSYYTCGDGMYDIEEISEAQAISQTVPDTDFTN